jgi:hypothetical protein
VLQFEQRAGLDSDFQCDSRQRHGRHDGAADLDRRFAWTCRRLQYVARGDSVFKCDLGRGYDDGNRVVGAIVRDKLRLGVWMSDPALELAKLLNDTPELQRRLNDYVKAKSEAQEAESRAETKRAEAESTIRLVDSNAAMQQARLARAQAEHDEAAKESALRMQAARDHEARLLQRKIELDRREAALAQREQALEQARAHFKQATEHLASIAR